MTDVVDRLLSETRKDNLASDSSSDGEDDPNKGRQGGKVQKADGKGTLDLEDDCLSQPEQESEESIDRNGHEEEAVDRHDQSARFTPDSTVTLIYGPPGRGKSYLLRQMYMNPPIKDGKKAVDAVVVFTATIRDWADIPKCCVRDWNESILAKLLLMQSEAMKKIKGAMHVVITMDDLLAKVNYNTKLMTELLTRHRHYNVSVVIAAQNVSKTIHPLVRGQESRFICFDPPSLESCRMLYEAFCSSLWPTAKTMYKEIKKLNMAASHSYLVINVNDGSKHVGSG